MARPLRNRVLVRLEEKEEKKSAYLSSDDVNNKKDFYTGVVVMLGKTASEEFLEEDIVGKKVLIDGAMKGKAVEHKGETLYLFPVQRVEVVLE